MYGIFTKLLNMSFTAGVIVLVILLLRMLLKQAPRRLICTLWIVVALRLVLPISISSELSAFNLLDKNAGQSGRVEYFQYNGHAEKPEVEFVFPTITEGTESGNPVLVEAHTADLYLPAVIHIWITGMIAMLLYAVGSYAALKRSVRASIPLQGRIWLCDDLPSPFILGIVNPRIYIPSNMDAETAKYVIAHENAHIRRRDHIWKPFGFLLLAVYWFNPILWLGYVFLCKDIELACDEKVIADMDRSGKAAYSEALLHCSFQRRRIAACPLAFGEISVKKRVKTVLNYKKPTFWLVLVMLLSIAAVAIGFLTEPVKQVDSLTFLPVVDADNLRADFQVNLGNKVQNATVYAELWRNGMCNNSSPIFLDKETDNLSILISDLNKIQDTNSLHVQMNVDDRLVVFVRDYPVNKAAVGRGFKSWNDERDIPVAVGDEVILAAVTLDFGNGIRIFGCQDLITEPERLEEAEYMFVVRARFGDAAMLGKWDCSVICAGESDSGHFTTYSNQKISSTQGILSFENPNDFEIEVSLMTVEEMCSFSIPAGETKTYSVLQKDQTYLVGIHADVSQGTRIGLTVYDGEVRQEEMAGSETSNVLMYARLLSMDSEKMVVMQQETGNWYYVPVKNLESSPEPQIGDTLQILFDGVFSQIERASNSGIEPEIWIQNPSHISVVDRKMVFFLNFGGNTSLQQSFSITEEKPNWRIWVQNDGTEAINVEIRGDVYRIAPGAVEDILSGEEWEADTYAVSFATAGQEPMWGKVFCEVY